MLELTFQGWVQIRLATDPDPSDEPRGVSGWTYAVAGEPDLDRVIRLQDPVAPRTPGPTVGVSVVRVVVDGNEQPNHGFAGALVDLLDEPKFEGRNGVVSEDQLEFVHPFDLRVSGAGVSLRRRDQLAVDAGGGETPLHQVAPSAWRRRQPVGGQPPATVLAAIAVTNPAGFWQQRRTDVAAALSDARAAGDEVAVVALGKRHDELNLAEPGIRQALLGASLSYRFEINGPAEVDDPGAVLGTAVDRDQDWPIQFWIGGWDTDALCAYLRGTLTVPSP